MTHPSQHPIDTLRDKLAVMRDEEIARILKRSPVPALAAIEAMIAALDEVPAEAEPASRVVVSDDGRVIQLTIYGEAGTVAAALLHPIRAIVLASELIAAALLRLA